jgi:DNA-binding GntR family transcriptional regulator
VYRADHEFHSIVFTATGREYLINLLEQTWDKYHSVGIVALYNEEDIQEWIEWTQWYYPGVVKALEAGDGKKAAELFARLFEEEDVRIDQRALMRAKEGLNK